MAVVYDQVDGRTKKTSKTGWMAFARHFAMIPPLRTYWFYFHASRAFLLSFTGFFCKQVL